jgi:hypothetical protein
MMYFDEYHDLLLKGVASIHKKKTKSFVVTSTYRVAFMFVF